MGSTVLVALGAGFLVLILIGAMRSAGSSERRLRDSGDGGSSWHGDGGDGCDGGDGGGGGD